MTDLVEGRPDTSIEVRPCELPTRQAAVVRISGSVPELPVLMDRAFSVTSRAITSAGARFAGHPFARYTSFGERIEAMVGFPFVGDVPATEGVEITELPGGRAATVRHIGPYDEIGLAWERATTYMKEHGLTPTGPGWECYLTGPGDPGPPITEIYWPLD